MVTHAHPAGPPPLTATGTDALYRRLRSRASWAKGGRGALDALTPARVPAATREMGTGRTVTLAAPVETSPGPDNPEPSRHEMRGSVGRRSGYPNVFGWHRDLKVLDFLSATSAELDIDEYDMAGAEDPR
ncbi:hypothetical protein ABZ642_28500 [Streptomyces sp. NPDC007157]|uniref:hypothetical protein n=1 Tax=Streptomyces sp. NPDC007157 TaxID=3154681 RepID=UPI00340D4EEC